MCCLFHSLSQPNRSTSLLYHYNFHCQAFFKIIFCYQFSTILGVYDRTDSGYPIIQYVMLPITSCSDVILNLRSQPQLIMYDKHFFLTSPFLKKFSKNFIFFQNSIKSMLLTVKFILIKVNICFFNGFKTLDIT